MKYTCLLYTSDAADDMQCVDLGGRRIIKKTPPRRPWPPAPPLHTPPPHAFFQAEDGIRDVERSRGLGDVYKRQGEDDEFLYVFIVVLIPFFLI